jgi:xylan 1,4-beta-xylosidase
MTKINNPILSGFHADPSILAVNGEFFIANSTFEWYPGVEIHRSKDLVHWTSVPSPLSEGRLLDMAGEVSSCGIWAPCLSYSEGKFWLIYTDVKSWNKGPWKDTPNYLTTAPTIEGPWSDPVFLNSSGFDPSMFHDDDGKHYLINMEWDYRETGAKQFSGLLVQEYSVSRKKLIGKIHKVFLGTDIGLVEGPHLYKRNGYYYIAAAEGGTCYEHAITVARSKNLFGPYEVHPSNPFISSYMHHDIMLQKAGHGSWCDGPDGKTFLVYLCGRPLKDSLDCPLGRETGLAEVAWKDDWPYVVQTDGSLSNTPPDYVEVPWNVEMLPGEKDKSIIGKAADEYCTTTKYDFNTKDFLKDFKTLRYPIFTKKQKSRFSIDARKGFLRIVGGQSFASYYQKGILARRQRDFYFEAETKVYFEPTYFQQLAGLTYRYDEDTQYNLCVTYDEKMGKVLQYQSFMLDKYEGGLKIPLTSDSPVWLKVTAEYDRAYFSYSEDGKLWKIIRPELDVHKLSDEYGGQGFTGAFVGMFCVDMAEHSKYADFEYFSYTKK